MNTNPDPLAGMTRPDVGKLIEVLHQCGPVYEGGGNVSELDDIRFCRWQGQSPDGKKHGSPDKPAFPFENAADGQPLMADAIIEERSSVLIAAFWRSAIKPKVSTEEAGNYAVKLVDHLLNRDNAAQLFKEVALSANHLEQYGTVVLNPIWEQRISKKRVKVTIEELLMIAQAMGQEQPGSRLEELGVFIADPEQEDNAVAVVSAIYARLAEARATGNVKIKIPELSEKTIRKAIGELRKSGEAMVPVPYLAANGPKIHALKVFEDVWVPADTQDVDRARVVFHRQWMTEAEVRAKETEDWDKQWIEAAVKTAGLAISAIDIQTGGALTSAVAIGRQPGNVGMKQSDLIEVLNATYQVVDEDGVSEIHQTTFSAHVPQPKGEGTQSLYAHTELVSYSHGELPYVGGNMEYWSRQFLASRGVPEIVRTWQNQTKALDDAIIDFTSMAVLPPVNVPKTPLGTKYKFGPAVQNEIIPGREPQFMQIPTSGVPYALNGRAAIEQRVANRFGLMSETVPAPRWQLTQGVKSSFFLLMWSKALQQVVALVQQYMSDGEFSAITGAPLGWLDAHRDHLGALAVSLSFDVRDLDPELTLERIKAVNTMVIPADVGGVINRNKWVEKMLRAINPEWVSDLIMPAAAASEQVWNQVSDDIAKMFLGNEVRYVENDPTAPTKLQYAEQIVKANPNYAAAMQQPGRFQELMQKYAQNLTFSVQQQQNKQIGRIGVQPETP